jgi:Leucine-rich repeat (LRR) protein
LDIGDNNIPNIPPVIAALTNLTFLRLSKNPINNSPLPDQLGTTISRLASRVHVILAPHL